MTNAYLITGNTYPHRRTLRGLGCLFDYDEKGYVIAKGKADKVISFAEQNGLTCEPIDADQSQLTPAEGEKLREIRQAKKDRYRDRLLKQAESAEKRAAKARGRISDQERDFLRLGEPIKIGHHSERRHRKLIERFNSAFDAEMTELTKAKKLREEAESLLPVQVKGDAERRRQKARDYASARITVGDTISDGIYGEGVVLRVNKNTFTVDFRGLVRSVDKRVLLVAKGDGTAPQKEHKFKAGDKVTVQAFHSRWPGVVKRRTSTGYSVEYTWNFGDRIYTKRETFDENRMELGWAEDQKHKAA